MANESVSKIAQLTDTDGATNLYPYTVPDAIVGLEDYVKEHGSTETYTLPVATPSVLGGVKPVTKSSDMTQSVGVDTQGGLWVPSAPSVNSGSGKRTCRFVIGTSTAGWTADDCDYLCDGVDDHIEIQNAINAMPATGGKIILLDGTYNISKTIQFNTMSGYRVGVLCGNGGNYSTCVLKWVGTYATDTIPHTGMPGRNTILSVSHSYVSNITFDMGSQTAAAGNVCLCANEGSSIQTCTFTNAPTGIATIGSYRISISNCYISDCGTYGAYIYGVTNFIGNTIIPKSNSTCIFIKASAGDSVVISANSLVGSGYVSGVKSIEVTDYPKDVLVTGNVCTNTSAIINTTGQGLVVNNLVNVKN